MYQPTTVMNFQLPQQDVIATARKSSHLDRSYANQLSDELLLHMLDCDSCLTGCLDSESINCPVHRGLMKQIAAFGGPSQPLVFAY